MNLTALLILLVVLINAVWAGLNFRLSRRLQHILRAQRQELDALLERLRRT